MGQGEGALTHGNEHDDRQGVVHGVSAHSPPCQTDHLPSKGPLALLAGEMGCGGSQLGVPSSPDPCSCRHLPSELILTVHQDHSVSGCSRPPHVSLGHIWGQKDSMFPFISNGKAAPCSFTVTEWHVSQEKPCGCGRPDILTLLSVLELSGGDWLPPSISLGQTWPSTSPTL